MVTSREEAQMDAPLPRFPKKHLVMLIEAEIANEKARGERPAAFSVKIPSNIRLNALINVITTYKKAGWKVEYNTEEIPSRLFFS